MSSDKKLKIVVCGHDQKFWNPIQSYLEKTDLFEFREDYWSGHNEHNKKISNDCIQWADIIVAEWTLGNAVYYSKHKKMHQRLITRFHLQERNTDYPGLLKMENVDKIIFVSDHIKDEATKKFKLPPDKTCVVSNFVDFAKYNLEKHAGSEFNLGMIGIVPMRKRMDLAVEVLEELLKLDSRYRLHIKGANPASYAWLMKREEEKEYYLNLFSKINAAPYKNKIIFDPPGSDIQNWFQKIGYILSPSNFESFHMAIPEGLCSGTIPIVWGWEGASDIYKYLIPVSDSTIIALEIDRIRKSSTQPLYAQQSKNYVKDNFDIETVITKWKNLLINKSDSHQEIKPTPQKSLIIVWCIDNWKTFHRSEMLKELANNLKDTANILLIEPGNNYNAILAKGWDSEETLIQFTKNKPVKITSNLYRSRLILNGTPHVLKHLITTGTSNKARLGIAAKKLTDSFFGNDQKIIHWFYKPNQTYKCRYPENASCIYEVYDDYTKDFGNGEIIERMVELEKSNYPDAKHVFFTSEVLADRKQSLCHSHSVVSNGVDYPIFAKYRHIKSSSLNKRYSVGYLGNLAKFFNWELIQLLVDKLPEMDFYFHGNIEITQEDPQQKIVETLKNKSNVVFTGRINREQGAAAIARYDCLIIPFVNNDAMDAVNPLKLWEYLAVGRPIISSKMEAIEKMKGHIYFADTVSEWVNAIQTAISEDTKEKYQSRCEIAKNYAWGSLTQLHANTIKVLIS